MLNVNLPRKLVVCPKTVWTEIVNTETEAIALTSAQTLTVCMHGGSGSLNADNTCQLRISWQAHPGGDWIQDSQFDSVTTVGGVASIVRMAVESFSSPSFSVTDFAEPPRNPSPLEIRPATTLGASSFVPRSRYFLINVKDIYALKIEGRNISTSTVTSVGINFWGMLTIADPLSRRTREFDFTVAANSATTLISNTIPVDNMANLGMTIRNVGANPISAIAANAFNGNAGSEPGITVWGRLFFPDPDSPNNSFSSPWINLNKMRSGGKYSNGFVNGYVYTPFVHQTVTTLTAGQYCNIICDVRMFSQVAIVLNAPSGTTNVRITGNSNG